MRSCAWYEGAALGRVMPQGKRKGDEDGLSFCRGKGGKFSDRTDRVLSVRAALVGVRALCTVPLRQGA